MARRVVGGATVVPLVGRFADVGGPVRGCWWGQFADVGGASARMLVGQCTGEGRRWGAELVPGRCARCLAVGRERF